MMVPLTISRLFAGEERNTKRQSLRDPLEVLTKHIDFVVIAAAVDTKLKPGSSGRGGRQPYPTVVMVKLLLCSGCTTCPTIYWNTKCSIV